MKLAPIGGIHTPHKQATGTPVQPAFTQGIKGTVSLGLAIGVRRSARREEGAVQHRAAFLAASSNRRIEFAFRLYFRTFFLPIATSVRPLARRTRFF